MSEHQFNIQVLENQLKEHDTRVNKICEKLRRMRQNSPITVSDHAILRFLERSKGLDLYDTIIKEIVTPDVLKYYQILGDGEFPTGIENGRVVIKNGCVVTFKK